LSSQRLLNRTITTKLTIALSAPAFAFAAIVVGGLTGSAQAAPIAPVRVVSVASSASALAFSASDQAAASSRRLSAVHPDATKPKKKKKKHKHVTVKHHKRVAKHHKHLTAKQIAWDIMGWYGWKAKWQFRYLNYLWMRDAVGT
jgi:predicted aspartyl protease